MIRPGGARRLRRYNHNAARFKTTETGHGGFIAATRSYCSPWQPRTVRQTRLHHGRAAIAEYGLRQHGGHWRRRGKCQFKDSMIPNDPPQCVHTITATRRYRLYTMAVGVEFTPSNRLLPSLSLYLSPCHYNNTKPLCVASWYYQRCLMSPSVSIHPFYLITGRKRD